MDEIAMHVHEVRSIEIEAPYEHVFTFIADPSNLPRWTHAFEQVSSRKAITAFAIASNVSGAFTDPPYSRTDLYLPQHPDLYRDLE